MIIKRICPRGRTYVLTGDSRLSETTVQLRDKTMTFPMNIMDIDSAWLKWTMGREMVQHAFPQLNPDQREFLISGLLPEEFDALFKEED